MSRDEEREEPRAALKRSMAEFMMAAKHGDIDEQEQAVENFEAAVFNLIQEIAGRSSS
jgi:hypothetical protein